MQLCATVGRSLGSTQMDYKYGMAPVRAADPGWTGQTV